MLKKLLLLFLPVFVQCQGFDKPVDKSLFPTKVITREILALKDTTLYLNAGGTRKVNILYTGCGGLVIEFNGEAFMTDPYYTAHNIAEVLSFIKAKPENEQKVLGRIKTFIDPHKINSVLVSHSHYDHLEDLPGLLYNKELSPDVKVLGSQSAYTTIHNFLPANRFINSDYYQERHKLPLQEGKFLILSPHIRVMPIQSIHAPHFHGRKLMEGETKAKDFKEFDDPFEKTKALEWREGSSYSYLVHLITDQPRDTFRLFIQTSASNAPFGFPPREQLTTNRKIDLAIICFASHKYVNYYPQRLLDTLKPKKTMIIHWEDFFKDYEGKEPRVVVASDEKEFMTKLENIPWVGKGNLKKYFVMPKPMVRMVVRY